MRKYLRTDEPKRKSSCLRAALYVDLTLAGILLLSACGGSRTGPSSGATPSNPAAKPATYQGPLQNTRLSAPTDPTTTAREIAEVMENNPRSQFPEPPDDVFASCQQYSNPAEFGCPWKAQNAETVAQEGAYAAPILATGIVYLYVNDNGIYDVQVPNGGDDTPVGASLAARTISPPASQLSPTQRPQSSTSTLTRTQTQSATTVAPPSGASQRFFHSPSLNIQCELDNAPAIVGIRAYCQTNTPPASATLSARGVVKPCAGEGCLANGPDRQQDLPYGQTLSLGPFTCRSLTTGMRCTVVGGRGFVISRSGVQKLG